MFSSSNIFVSLKGLRVFPHAAQIVKLNESTFFKGSLPASEHVIRLSWFSYGHIPLEASSELSARSTISPFQNDVLGVQNIKTHKSGRLAGSRMHKNIPWIFGCAKRQISFTHYASRNVSLMLPTADPRQSLATRKVSRSLGAKKKKRRTVDGKHTKTN